MKFKVAERLMLLNLLPQEGDIVTLRVVRDAQMTVSLSEEELEELDLHNPVKATCTVCGFVVSDIHPDTRMLCPPCGGVMKVAADGNRLIWKSEADVEKEIPLGPKVTSIIVDKLTKLNEEKKLTLQQLGLYEKFVEPPEADDKVVPLKKE